MDAEAARIYLFYFRSHLRVSAMLWFLHLTLDIQLLYFDTGSSVGESQLFYLVFFYRLGSFPVLNICAILF